ncbi:MAG: futalosine hydrolase, partial [Bacteroidota bacterium]
MKILVVAATQRELEPGLKLFQEGEAGTHSVSFHSTGVGLTAAAIAITRLTLQHSPDLIIQAGIAGCFQEQLSIGDVVFIQSDRQADLGVWENNQWKNVHDLS